MVYDPDQALVTDIVACEDAHESERTVAQTLVAGAQAGELWLADSHFCTRTLLQGWQQAQAAFIVREHGTHPHLVEQGRWQEAGRCETGVLTEQSIGIEGEAVPWRRIQLVLDEPTRDGLTQLRLWSNLPPEVTAGQIANLYRRRWRIEGLFGRLESVLNSEIRTLGPVRTADYLLSLARFVSPRSRSRACLDGTRAAQCQGDNTLKGMAFKAQTRDDCETQGANTGKPNPFRYWKVPS